MKKILFTLLLLGLYGAAMAQAEGPGNIIKPDVTPPSPQAYALTKYGDIPINEFTGMVNASIPVYTAKVGKLELPITLNYAAAGVKVSQPATWTGINWTLNAGGVITRTINDAPDESTTADKRLTADMIIPSQLINGSAHAYFLNGVFVGARKHYDFKPDLFSYSFGNYSGTFYFDKDFVPQFSKLDSNMKIEIVGMESDLRQRFRNSQAFCITTPDGVKYYFGGENATESTFMGANRDNPYANTGFYLTKIQHPEYGIIGFEYDTETVNYSIWLNEEESVTIKISESRLGELCKRPATNEDQHLISSTGTITKNGKWLKRIYSITGNLEILFNRSNGSTGNYKYVLNSIVAKEGSTVVRKADFTYLFPQTPTTSERFFLTKVEFDKDRNYGSSQGRKNEEYILEYNSPLELPSRRSQAKDLAGYYNGHDENTTALPQNQDLWFNNYYPYLADRTPDCTYAIKGTLKKIIYPTKGYTLFEYECQKAKEYDRQHRSLTIWRNNPVRIPTSKTSVTIPYGDFYSNPDGTMGTTTAVMDEEIKVRVDLFANAQMGHTDQVFFKLIDLTTNTTQLTAIQMPDGNAGLGTNDYNYTREFTVNVIKDHLYSVELSNSYSSTVQFEATAYFFHTKGFKTIDENGGLRVLRTTDFSAADNNAYVKRFYYRQAKDLSADPYSLLNFRMNFEFVKDLYLLKCCNPRVDPNEPTDGPILLTHTGDIKLRTFSSGTGFNDVFDKKYEYVTISYGGDNFELGGKEKRFNKTPMFTDIGIHLLQGTAFQEEKNMYRGNLESVYHGTLLSETDLIKKGEKFYKIAEQVNEYQYTPVGSGITGITGGYAYMNCTYPQDGADNLDIGRFEFLSKKVGIISQTRKEFTVPMPLDAEVLFEPSYRIITTKTEFEYGGLAGLPTLIKTTTSEDNVVRWVTNTYADQPTLVPNATPAQVAAMNKLVELNKVSEPVMVRTVVGQNPYAGSRTGTKVTLYKSWNNNPNLILPEVIRFAKGNATPEDRIVMHQYDTRGNLTLVSAANGAKTKYEYDGNGNVTVKIDNYVGPDTPIEAPNVPIDFEPGTPGPCTFSTIYPGGLVTWYYYDNVTRLLRRTIDSNCRSTYYEYDALLRLKRIKDHDGNTIEEYDNNYRTN